MSCDDCHHPLESGGGYPVPPNPTGSPALQTAEVVAGVEPVYSTSVWPRADTVRRSGQSYASPRLSAVQPWFTNGSPCIFRGPSTPLGKCGPSTKPPLWPPKSVLTQKE